MPITLSPTILASLTAQRLCHDLVNPISAVHTGLELLEISEPQGPEITLMRQSLDAAMARIRLYRLAFGAGDDGRISTTDLERAMAALGASRPLTVSLNVTRNLTRREARLLCLLALCCETALAWGGSLNVEAGEAFTLTASAERLKLEPERLWEDLVRGTVSETPTSRDVHFALAVTSARDESREIRAEMTPQEVRLRLLG